MIDVESKLVEQLEALVPLPTTTPDWRDVLTRANALQPARRTAHRRSIAVAVAFAAAATALVVAPSRSAIVSAYSAVGDWISNAASQGESPGASFMPGERAWTSFGSVTRIHRIGAVGVGHSRLDVYGVRSASSICLRIDDRSRVDARMLSCLPVERLQTDAAPAVVASVDYGFTDDAAGAPVQVTAGIIADGVRKVIVTRSDGSTVQAALLGNTFVSAALSDRHDVHTTSVAVVTEAGTKLTVPLSGAPVDTSLPAAVARPVAGPTTIQRSLSDGRIGWLMDREARGVAAPSAPSLPRGNVIHRRMLAPDPRSPFRVVVSLMGGSPPVNPFFPGRPEICFDLIGQGAGGGGCDPVDLIFTRQPFVVGEQIVNGSDQAADLYGVVSDDVSRLEIYLADGSVIPVNLADNTFVESVIRSSLPARVVAYDEMNRVVGIDRVTDAASR